MSLPSKPRLLPVIAASCLLTTAGGTLDAWVYLAHGHVFATAQSGNVILMGVALARGDPGAAALRLPSLIAFVAGLLGSRLSGEALKRRGLNSRTVRLGGESLLLLGLAMAADHLPDRAVTACVGFLAGVQITSLSHIGRWSFNTGMTTGNLRAAAAALSNALAGKAGEGLHALTLAGLCVAFTLGAVAGAWLTPRLGGATLLPMAALVALAATITRREPDPVPGWEDLR